MADVKCRSCSSAADAGAYCSACAAEIMAKALNPSFGSRRKRLPKPEPVKASKPEAQQRLFQ